ncbi:MAG: tetraacyldisaccharide 4'-kinase [Phycisphaera sp.]|nr:tetraacyldisaccharide 4'-kinase [Phycisphaera sp.]
MTHRVTFTEHLRIHETMSGADRSLRAHMFRFGTAIAEPFYAAAVTLRNKLYDWGVKRTHKVNLPVISIGNITTGGTGKTPMVIYIVQLLQRHGYRPAVVLRGYMPDYLDNGAPSDEAILLCEQLSDDVPIVPNADRVAAARELEQRGDVDVLVLDDAFQHRRIHRDLDLVLVDATEPFGYDHVLPRGMLREPLRGMRRADAIVATRVAEYMIRRLGELDKVDDRIARGANARPLAHATHAYTEILDERDEHVDFSEYNKPYQEGPWPVYVVQAIGNPSPLIPRSDPDDGRFEIEPDAHTEVTPSKSWVRAVDELRLPDHHVYTQEFVDGLSAKLKELKAVAVLTTEKDWVKLRPLLESSPDPAPVWRQQMEMRFLDGEEAFEKLILDAVKAHATMASATT